MLMLILRDPLIAMIREVIREKKNKKEEGEANLKWLEKKGTVMAALRLINFRQCGCANFEKLTQHRA